MYSFSTTPQIGAASLGEAAHEARPSRVMPRRWAGQLRRAAADSIAASSWMEGVQVDADEAAHSRWRSPNVGGGGRRGARGSTVTRCTRLPGGRSRLRLVTSLVLDVHRIAMAASRHANAGAFQTDTSTLSTASRHLLAPPVLV
jgi:hypothetical protein